MKELIATEIHVFQVKYPAVCIAHTPTGPTPCCENHARQIVGLFNFMGAHVHIEATFDDLECENCNNEAKNT